MLFKYLSAGLGVALLVALAAVSVQTSRLGTVKAERRALENEHASLADACQDKDVTITQLEDAVSTLRVAAVKDAERLRVAAVAVGSLRDILRARDAQLDNIERGDYAKPDCAALMGMDLALVCPGIARSLRERAEGNLP